MAAAQCEALRMQLPTTMPGSLDGHRQLWKKTPSSLSLLAAAKEYQEQNAGENTCLQPLFPLAFDVRLATATATTTAPPVQHQREERESYLMNLQPSPGSAFHEVIYKMRARCAEELGSDPTYLYPIHVSVTGFFEARQPQIDALLRMAEGLLQAELRAAGLVRVGKVICTDTGYVVFDMQAQAIRNFVKRLEERCQKELELPIRAKAVNHISLACERNDQTLRENIRSIYEPAKDSSEGSEACAAHDSARFDLVLSRLVRRSSFERMAEDGPHKFVEVARLPAFVATA